MENRMIRNLENVNKIKILELLKILNAGIFSMIENYKFLYSKRELQILSKYAKLLENEFLLIRDNSEINVERVMILLEMEMSFKLLCYRCWEYENNNGSDYISWFKTDKVGEMPRIVSSTFSNKYNFTFCNSRFGIKYNITNDAFLGACEKDAATVVEPCARWSFYTIGKIENDCVVNSYNLATSLITPSQLICKDNNVYSSKHNEIVLDSKYIEPTSVVYFDDSDLDIVLQISKKYAIPTKKILFNNRINIAK